MTGGPALQDALERARRLPSLRVGLHLVLADGWAVSAPALIPALADGDGRMDGRMFARGLRYFLSPEARRQIEHEVRAQFQAFAATGLALDHVNVHKHFHLHPTLLSLLLKVGREFGAGAIRLPREPWWFGGRGGAPLAGPASALLLSPWIGLMRRRFRAAGIAHNDQVFGIACSGRMDEERLVEILGRLPPGTTELYLHPATESGARIAGSMHGYRHADELAALLSPRVKAALAASGVATGGYADLRRARGGPRG
jgi:hopanoid biosynthesis associated protein HpnK